MTFYPCAGSCNFGIDTAGEPDSSTMYWILSDEAFTDMKNRIAILEDQNAVLRQRLALHGESVLFPADPPANHTASDIKPEPKREPKPIPAGALKPKPTDSRRIGG